MSGKMKARKEQIGKRGYVGSRLCIAIGGRKEPKREGRVEKRRFVRVERMLIFNGRFHPDF